MILTSTLSHSRRLAATVLSFDLVHYFPILNALEAILWDVEGTRAHGGFHLLGPTTVVVKIVLARTFDGGLEFI